MRPGCSTLIASLAMALLAAAPQAQATTITVNSPLDTSGNGAICTLRDAITAANNNAPAGGCAAGSPYPALDTINIPQSRNTCLLGGCVIIPGSPLPTIVEDVTIAGTGNWVPVINGSNARRIFTLGGVVVNLTNLTLINGYANGAGEAGFGGAILTSTLDTTLTVNRVTFSGNRATSRGGALHVAGGTITVNDSTFVNNTSDTYGGGISQTDGLLIVNRSTLTGNTAGDGGGLEIQGFSETRLTNVTFSGNTARGNGGAISRIGTGLNVSLNNVTITGNTADSDNNGSGDGGGLYRGGGTVTASNSIIAGNFDSPNNAGTGTIHPDCSWQNGGALTSNGYNLLGTDAGCAGLTDTVNGDRVGTAGNPLDARFGPLTSNGGFTQTRALLADSQAIDAGSPLTPGGGGFAPCAATDQRNITRPIGAACDMGAYEAPLDDEDRDGIVNSQDNCIYVANGPAIPDAGGGSQRDSDGDGYGNLCDGDLNNNEYTNAQDTVLFRAQLGQPSVLPDCNAADFNCNGFVNAQDTVIFRQLLGSPPGPSGLNCTPGVDKCGWDVGDLVTFNQVEWGTADSTAGNLLSNSFGPIYFSSGGILEVGIAGAGGQSITFTSGSAVLAFLPAIGIPESLTSDEVNPTFSSSRILGGEVTALALNVDFSAGGLLGGSLTSDFGTLSICGASGLPNMSVASFRAIAENMLGGANTGYLPTTIVLLAQEINAAFDDGTPSAFAQAHLASGDCP